MTHLDLLYLLGIPVIFGVAAIVISVLERYVVLDEGVVWLIAAAIGIPAAVAWLLGLAFLGWTP